MSFAEARAGVPFPAVLEVILMELAFELLREAGVRVPGSIGSTIGIVGGLIIGQAAVEANLVSPIMIIIVAVTGIASFTVPSYSLSFAFRFSRFLYIFGASGDMKGTPNDFVPIAARVFTEKPSLPPYTLLYVAIMKDEKAQYMVFQRSRA